MKKVFSILIAFMCIMAMSAQNISGSAVNFLIHGGMVIGK